MSFDPKDFISASITKSPLMEDCGLKVTEYNGDVVIYEVGGVFEMFTQVKPGSRLIKLQDKDIKEYGSIEDIKREMAQARSVRIEAVKIKDYNDIMNDSSNSEQDIPQLEEGIPEGC